MRRLIAALGLMCAGVALPASAQGEAAARVEAPPAAEALAPSPVAEPGPARRYASGSVSTLGSAAMGIGLIGASPAGSGFTALGLTGAVAVRWVTRLGLTLEPRLGADGMLATGAAGLYAVFAARAGVGVGYAFAPRDTAALTPMLAYEALLVGGGISANLSGVHHTFALELPATFFFGPNVFVEVFMRGGAGLTGVGVVPIFALGYRFGLVWR